MEILQKSVGQAALQTSKKILFILIILLILEKEFIDPCKIRTYILMEILLKVQEVKLVIQMKKLENLIINITGASASKDFGCYFK